MRITTLLFCSILMVGCASHNTQIYGKIDQDNKTVTVPPGSKGLKGYLKKLLSQNGWELVVYRGASVAEVELSEKTKMQQYDTFHSKYRLIVSSWQYDICFNLSPAIHYDISFINNP